MARKEFSSKTKMQAYARCLRPSKHGLKPHCEVCGLVILGLPEYDHDKPDGLGGDNTLQNCKVCCGKCHKEKTHGHDIPIMRKADAQKKSAANAKRKYKWPKRKFGQ